MGLSEISGTFAEVMVKPLWKIVYPDFFFWGGGVFVYKCPWFERRKSARLCLGSLLLPLPLRGGAREPHQCHAGITIYCLFFYLSFWSKILIYRFYTDIFIIYKLFKWVFGTSFSFTTFFTLNSVSNIKAFLLYKIASFLAIFVFDVISSNRIYLSYIQYYVERRLCLDKRAPVTSNQGCPLRSIYWYSMG